MKQFCKGIPKKLTRPLPAGTKIEWNGNVVEVVEDDGNNDLLVHTERTLKYDYEPIEWEWLCGDIECTICDQDLSLGYPKVLG